MSVTITTPFNGGNNDNTNNFSGSVTAAVGASHLIVGITFDFASLQPYSTVTYDGNEMTNIGSTVTGSGRPIRVFSLANPPSGSNTLAFTGSFSGGKAFAGYSLFGADTFGVADVTDSNSTNSQSVSPASSVNDLVIGFCSFNDNESVTDNQTNIATGGGSWTQIVASSKVGEATNTTLSWDKTTAIHGSAIGLSITPLVTGPTLTGPDTTTVDAVRVATGTNLDTVTTAGLKLSDDSYSLSLPIDAQTATTLTQTDNIDVGLVVGTPVNSLPVEADVLATGATAYQIQQWVDDGVNPEVARNITLNYLSGYTTVQGMIATSNTTPGQSFFGANIIAVEDNMQATGPDVVDTVAITYNADGTITTDKDQTINFDMRYWSPSTGQASIANLTVKDTSIISVGSGITRPLTRSLARSLTRSL